MNAFLKFIYLSVAMLFIIQCNRPKTIKPEGSSSISSTKKIERTGIFSEFENAGVNAELNMNGKSTIHEVIIEEVLPTERYVYMKVKEEDEHYWIATGKKDITLGESYYYKNGILKTNFESKEYNRIFDKIYLVSNIVPSQHGGSQLTVPTTNSFTSSDAGNQTENFEMAEGSIAIAEIVENPAKYQNTKVQISAKCVKINPNIMGRNWLHLKDGTKDDFDLVATTETFVPEQSKVTLEGIVSLKRDFGAGYYYEIIIEEGKILSLK